MPASQYIMPMDYTLTMEKHWSDNNSFGISMKDLEDTIPITIIK